MPASACLVNLVPKVNAESRAHRAHLVALGTQVKRASQASMVSQAKTVSLAKTASQESKVLGVHQERRVRRAILVMR